MTKKLHQINVKVSEQEYEKYKELSKLTDLTVSQAARRGILRIYEEELQRISKIQN